MKSVQNAKSFRTVSDCFVPSSRTITRTISGHPLSLSGLHRGRRGPREGCEAKVFSAVRAKHDSVGQLLECRCAAATGEVFEALRHRAGRSIKQADVIEREILAGFSAPFNSSHGKLGNSHILIYTGLEHLAARVREYCPVAVAGPVAGPCPLNLTINANSLRKAPSDAMSFREELPPRIARTSASLPDVPLQVSELVALTGERPCSVRVLESAKHGS
jgi:hypothetical protein